MDIAGDNRFEVIKKAKEDLIESTNIEMSPDEMKVLDDFLFRCWQMGWLHKYEDADKFNAPTEDAVSLKWLASWTKKYIEKTRSEVGVLSEKAVTVAEAFNEMKHDWREENV